MDRNPNDRLSPEAIRDFKRIYKEEFGDDLTDNEAKEIAGRVIRFFGILEDRGR